MKSFQGEIQPFCYLLDRFLSFQSERELAGADFHRRKDRAFQGTHNNICERAIRPVVMGRKAWLFAGSLMAGNRAAQIMSLLETAKRNGLEPHSWLTDVLTRLPEWPEERLAELLPLEGFTFSW